jgi:L-ascorbate metabolism protein UlaG (beta-lactamase superfamily)
MLRITYHGHSCFEIEHGGKNIIIDPFLEGNPNAEKRPQDIRADMVIVTHAHPDHFGDADKICKQDSQPLFVSTYEVANYAQSKKGIENVHRMHIGGEYDFGYCKVKLTQALHGSSDENNNTVGLAAGVVLRIGDKTLYHAGDTGLFGDMSLIGKREKPEIVMLPIGGNFTMGIDDALYAVGLLKPDIVIPMHYGTFPVVDADPQQFVSKLPRNRKGIIFQFGESKEFD